MATKSQSKINSSGNDTIRIVKYGDLIPCFNAFIDTRTPGSNKKENFTIIGPGVSENPEQHVHIIEPHGFNIGGARQPPGCVNSQHSHDTEEVFFVHQGTWSFNLGEHGEDAKVTLKPGDLISIPTQVFRGFENIGDDVGFLWAVLGGDDPGRVLWAPDVFAMAEKYGLMLLEDGSLIDINKTIAIPEGKNPMPVTTREQVSDLKMFNNDDLRKCCSFESDVVSSNHKLIAEDGDLNWAHGFEITRHKLAPSQSISPYECAGSEVLFVHEGQIIIQSEDQEVIAERGDTVTVASDTLRSINNPSPIAADYLSVRLKS